MKNSFSDAHYLCAKAWGLIGVESNVVFGGRADAGSSYLPYLEDSMAPHTSPRRIRMLRMSKEQEMRAGEKSRE